ncbi:hypothetical protein ACFL0M_08715 [Thermodesulfobacteriota bacterium]
MKTKKLLISFLAFLFVMCFFFNVYAAEKAKGKLITNFEKNYVKVIANDYKVHQIYFNKKTKVEATVKSNINNLAIAKEGKSFPSATVTYVIKGGKAVAEKISYQSKAGWGIKKKKKKKK